MPTLDIACLRSLAAVAAFGGTRRAAGALHLSPAAVSGHIRRLEAELGCPLVTRVGRGIALTSDGEELAARGRVVLETHDEAVRAVRPAGSGELVIAATEYAAEVLVPAVVDALRRRLPGVEVRFRFTRSAWVRELARDQRADIGLALDRPSPGARLAGTLPLQWMGLPDAPRDRVVAYAQPCSVRRVALPVLGRRAYAVTRECNDLAGLLAALRAGEGVAAIPRIGPLPDGLHRLTDLPALPHIRLYATSGPRVPPAAQRAVHAAVAAMAVPVRGTSEDSGA